MPFRFSARRLKAIAWGACALLPAAPGPSAAEVVVIVNKNAPDNITRDQVADIFMGRRTVVSAGTPAEPQDLPASSPLREEFYSKLMGRSAAQVKSYWAKMAFTGKGTPPKEAESSADVRRAVAAHPGGIGYVEKAAVDGSVKVILTVN